MQLFSVADRNAKQVLATFWCKENRRRYDLNLWIDHLREGATYLPR